ncbi:hypothetical protein JCM5296_004252 [Sporobolomyces johnsonii]
MLLPSHSSPLAFALCALAILSSGASAKPTADLGASEWTLVKRCKHPALAAPQPRRVRLEADPPPRATFPIPRSPSTHGVVDTSLPPPVRPSPHAALLVRDREKRTAHRSHPSRYASSSSSSAYPASGSKSSAAAAAAADAVANKKKVMVYRQASTAALRQKRALVPEAEAGAQKRRLFKREVEVEADEPEEEEEEEEDGDDDDWAWMDDSAEGDSEGDDESVEELLLDERDDDFMALSSVSRMEIRMRRTTPLFG